MSRTELLIHDYLYLYKVREHGLEVYKLYVRVDRPNGQSDYEVFSFLSEGMARRRAARAWPEAAMRLQLIEEKV